MKNIGAGDYKVFDGSQSSRVHLAIFFRIILPWYGIDPASEDALIMYMLFLDVHHSLHLRKDLVYEWNGPMTSGGFLTIVINYLYNRVNFYYSWYKLHDFEITCLNKFRDYVYCIFCGDDNGFSVHPAYILTFTAKWLQSTSLDLGLRFTSELKGEIGDFRTIFDISFLKRKFRMCEEVGRYIAPMELESTVETLYWTRKGTKADEITCDNVDFVLKELSLHGYEIYSTWAPKICVIARKFLNHISDFSTYRIALHNVLSTPGFV